jgi:hypothetical protein
MQLGFTIADHTPRSKMPGMKYVLVFGAPSMRFAGLPMEEIARKRTRKERSQTPPTKIAGTK